jgi:putative DNA primase/helicase
MIARWDEAQTITPDDAAGQYLTRRGLWQTPVPRPLRYHPALPYHYPKHDNRRPTTHAALIAAIQGPDGRVVSVQRIYLTADGHKADVPAVKKFWPATTVIDGIVTPTTMNGAACRLGPATDELVVTEGIETALAVRLMMGKPTWAALSATGIEKLWVPETVHCLFIAADHDPDGKGEAAARALAQRLLREDRTKVVKIRKPQTPGTDWADSLGKA